MRKKSDVHEEAVATDLMIITSRHTANWPDTFDYFNEKNRYQPNYSKSKSSFASFVKIVKLSKVIA